MVRIRKDGTFSVCATGFDVTLERFKKRNECPCVAQWPSGGFLCSAWGSATPMFVDGKAIKFETPCSFEEAQGCPFFKDDKPANSEDWIHWIRRRRDAVKRG